MTAPLPSSAAIAYATADRFAPPAHMLDTSLLAPCTQIKVNYSELGVQMLAVCFADMVQQKLITLQLAEETKLLVVHTTHVTLHIAPNAASRLPQTGLAGWLTRSIEANDGANIHTIIRAAYGVDYNDPTSVLTGSVMQELTALGFYEDTVHEAGGIMGGLRKLVHAAPAMEHLAVPHCERIATLREPAARVLQMLHTISSQDAHLWETLLKEVRSAIASRIITPPPTSSIG